MRDEANKALLDIMDSHQDDIIESWTDSLWQDPATGFGERPRDEVKGNVTNCFFAYRDIIEFGKYNTREKFIWHIIELRGRGGFNISAPQKGFWGLRTVIEPILRQELSAKPMYLVESLSFLDQLTKEAILTLSATYQQEADRFLVEKNAQLDRTNKELEKAKEELEDRGLS